MEEARGATVIGPFKMILYLLDSVTRKSQIKEIGQYRTMNFVDLKTQYLGIKGRIDKSIQNVLDHGKFIMGPEVGELEEKLAEYVGVKHAICLSSGTDALQVAMMALGIGHGDEVITSPFTFIATAETIALVGAKPVFVDIDPKTFNIDPGLIEAAITEKTKAITPVSLFGQCADFNAINAIAQKHGIPVIEDGAQSFGATYNGKKSCGLSTIGATSFYPSKPLGCYGDGGALFTGDSELAGKMKQIRDHGQDRQYNHPVIGLNARMDTIQAAILLQKLAIYPEELKKRVNVGSRYKELLKGVVATPEVAEGCAHVYAQYTITSPMREELISKLRDRAIPTAVHYPVPLHRQPVFKYLDQPEGSFPVSEDMSRKVMSLPMHPYLTEPEQVEVANAIKDIIGRF